MSNWQSLISQDAVQGWFVFCIMILMMTCLLVESFRHPAHYRLRRHQRAQERLGRTGRPPTPEQPAQGH